MQVAYASTDTSTDHAGSNDAWFDQLVVETRPGLQRHALRYVSCPEDAQEILQEAYLKVFCILKEDRTGGHSPKALLYTATRNIAVSRLRHLKVVKQKSASVGIAEELRHDDINTEGQAATEQNFDKLRRAFDQLPPKCRNVFLMRLTDGMSHKAIGNRLGISVSSVEKHLANGIRRCTEQVAQA